MRNSDGAPEISVVIATCNRAPRLRACLDALALQQIQPGTFEVVVVDDGSVDGTPELLRDYRAPYPLHVVRQDNAGQAAALNRGIEAAAGRACLFLDDDILAPPGLVEAHRRAQRSSRPTVGVGPLSLKMTAAGWYARAFADAWHAHYAALDRDPGAVTWEDCYGGNLSAPREALRAAGGFAVDVGRGYDVQFARALARAGCALQYLPEAGAVQDERKGFPELTRDAREAGYADALLYLRSGDAPAALTGLTCGPRRKVWLRRSLVALRIPPRLLLWCGDALPVEVLRRYLHSLAQTAAYWQGVRRALGRTPHWARRASLEGV